MGKKLCDRDEVQFRQIRSVHMLDNEPSSEAFQPMPKDDSQLSMDRSACVTEEQSFFNFRARGGDTVAVYGLTVGEFEYHDISCYGDPLPNNPSHSRADYSRLSRSKQRKISKRLKILALNRGKIYP